MLGIFTADVKMLADHRHVHKLDNSEVQCRRCHSSDDDVWWQLCCDDDDKYDDEDGVADDVANDDNIDRGVVTHDPPSSLK